MLSIIIPTLNEEKYLPLLLQSIKKQKFSDYEIIVADAGSKDRTIEIAKQCGCRIVPGGLPSKGRNEGAKIAKGDLLLFLDADVILPQADCLEKALEKFHEKKFGAATFPFLFTGGRIYRVFSRFYNFWVVLTQKFLPHALGAFILIKKDIHQKVNGFDEKVVFCEDVEYVGRVKKIAKYGLLKIQPVSISNRRFEQEGKIKSCIKYILAEFHIIFLGHIKSDIFKYKFGHYKDKDETKK
jgi:glycosyltransferase involved in cell wall biosynthesis